MFSSHLNTDMMNKTSIILSTALTLLAMTTTSSWGQASKRAIDYVDPFIGTGGDGHTFPGACVPFGMVQASPETGNMGWDYCAGYRYDDHCLIGFAQDHLNGTGSMDLGDVLLFPFSHRGMKEFKSAFRKENEHARPGYYRVLMDDSGVDAEVTATEHTAFYRFKYSGNHARLLVNMQSGDVNTEKDLRTHVLEASLSMPDKQTIEGSLRVKRWTERQVFFVIKTSRSFRVDSILPPLEGEKAKKIVLSFDSLPDRELLVKVALSSVSVEGARASIEKENPAWQFEAVSHEAENKWQDLLGRASVEGADSSKTMFYTSLYRAYIQPNNIADTDGRYRGPDDKVHQSSSGTHYSTLSLWDTFRATHSLYTILVPEMVCPIVNSMLDFQQTHGVLPIWALWGKETNGMIGNHAVPVIAEALLKCFPIDGNRAFETIRATLTKSHKKSPWDIYLQYGYYPFDLVKVESASRTLESSYDDWCAAQMAKALGRKTDYSEFMRRSAFWKNLYDRRVGFIRGKDSHGEWRPDFDEFQIGHSQRGGGDFTEGNSWQYTWQVMHDPMGLARIMGGKRRCTERLDSLFTLTTVSSNNAEWTGDVTGLIGQYAHGNEPCHHVSYFYSLLGQAWKTQRLVREIVSKFYISRPDGLSGNDDCGQMSAWYVFTAMGFYPFNPASGLYVIGAPQVKSVKLKLPDGKTFTMKALGLSEKNMYVKAVRLNGKRLRRPVISHKDIMSGGTLVFEMTDKPQK